jgi:hypothetical protein
MIAPITAASHPRGLRLFGVAFAGWLGASSTQARRQRFAGENACAIKVPRKFSESIFQRRRSIA